MRSFSKLLAGSVGLAVTLGLMAAAGSAAGASTAQRVGSQQASRAAAPAWEKAVKHLKVGIPMSRRSSSAGCPPGTTHVHNVNWAGYVSCTLKPPKPCPPSTSCVKDVAGTTRVSLKFVVCDDCGYLFSVGIDGWRSPTAEQAGYGVLRSGGVTTYFTWWEMYPSTNNIQIVGTTVQPGDRISASVKRKGASYTLSVIDSTHAGNSFTVTANCGSCDNSTAEWIVQRMGTSPIPDFGKLQITGATAKMGSTSGSISAFPHAESTLVNSSGTVLIQPGPLNSRGNGFTDVWKASS
jgi:peptidase A4-like protein